MKKEHSIHRGMLTRFSFAALHPCADLCDGHAVE